MGKTSVNVPKFGAMIPHKEDNDSIGRRRFLKSLFGLGAVSEAKDVAAAMPKKKQPATIFWANLRNGQIGFPSGMSVPSGAPGSIMKLVTAAALHESGNVTDHTTVECRGSVVVHHQTYSCLYPHGKVDLTKAIGLSCNVFFATTAQKLSSAAILDYAQRFGLHEAIAGFPSGKFPTCAAVDSIPYALGLADDLQPNGLQLLRLGALVALSGTTPPLHNAVDEPRDTDVLRINLHANTWKILQQGMRLAGRAGTAKKVDVEDKLHGAFKTGTAPHGKTFQSWIIGYFPYEHPAYCFSLRAAVGTSQETAVPEAHRFLFAQTWPT